MNVYSTKERKMYLDVIFTRGAQMAVGAGALRSSIKGHRSYTWSDVDTHILPAQNNNLEQRAIQPSTAVGQTVIFATFVITFVVILFVQWKNISDKMTNLSFAMLSQNASRGYVIVTVGLEDMRRVGALLRCPQPPTLKTTRHIYHQSSPEATIHSHRKKKLNEWRWLPLLHLQ